MSCKHHNVGYRGQKYAVLYTDHEGEERVFGWQNESIGGLLDAARIWPVAKSCRIVPVEHTLGTKLAPDAR